MDKLLSFEEIGKHNNREESGSGNLKKIKINRLRESMVIVSFDFTNKIIDVRCKSPVHFFTGKKWQDQDF